VLQPGLFGRIQVAASNTYKGILVPDEAIGSDQNERVVYVVAADGKVSTKPVRPGPRLYGYRVIREGLDGTKRLDRQRPDARPPRRNHHPADGTAAGRREAAESTDGERTMRFAHFFVDRPIFAAVISIVLLLSAASPTPSCRSRNIPRSPANHRRAHLLSGRRPETIADTVSTPLEQQINGVEDMLYMSSYSTPMARCR
jgi:hypothetical protein